MTGAQQPGATELPDPTYVTVTDERYFLGTVALVNSLRLTENRGDVVVIDAGMTASQRACLASHCDVRPVPVDRPDALPLYFKPTVAMLGLHGLVVLIDSDMIVTSRLASLYAPAVDGALCAFPDTSATERRFGEWRAALGIDAPLRAQTYVNTGFLAFDFDPWEPTLRRWWELCDRGSGRRSPVPWGVEDPDLASRDPFLWGDQDVFNAILMSEVPAERIRFLDAGLVGVPHWPHYEAGARVVDRRTLAVTEDGRPLAILHYWDHPKPWAPGARTRLTSEAYVELMARLLMAGDVPIALPGRSLPVWLRDDLVGRIVRRGPRRARRAAKSTLGLLPEPAGRRVRQLLGRE